MRDELQTLLGGINATEGPKLPETDGNSAPFFGRGADLAVLRRVMHAVRTKSECRAVTVVGAPGIGKTRLIDEFIREVVQLDKPAVRTFRSIAPADGSSWSCFTQLLAQRFEIADSAGVEEAKVSVHKQVAQVLDDRKVGDVLYLLGDLLGLEFPKSPVTRAFGEGAPETDVVRRAILKSFLDADAARGPLCLVFDDLHLAKAPTLDMLRSLVETLKAPVLFLCAARPELLGRREALPLHDAHTVLHLDPLTALDSAALIGSKLTPEGMTPMHLVEKTRAVTGGNPGRIEEVARVYRDKGTLPPPPDTPDAAVETRLEDLAADERRLLQKAAVMGGVFWLGGLIVLDRADRPSPDVWNSGEDPGLPELTDCLARLTERDYVMRLPDSTFPADEEYVFRRRTERDRLAALTPPADARRWHRLLADWLDSQPETRSHEEYLELLAEQREQSGALDSAASVYLEAAGQARAHRAPKRELAFYERALALLGDDGPSRRLTALLRAAELHEEGGSAALALERYREAATLAFRLDRRRLWETARLAMSRVIEAHATRIASHPAPKPPVSAVVPVAPPAHTPRPLPAISEGWPPTVIQAPTAPAAAPMRAVSAEPFPLPIDDRLTPVVAYPLPPTVAEPMPAPQATTPVAVAGTMAANATPAEPASAEPTSTAPTSTVPTSTVPTSTEGPVSGQDIDLVHSAPSIPAEPAAEVASPAAPAAQAEPAAAPATPEPSVEAASPAESSPAETASVEKPPAEASPAEVEPAPPSPTPDPPDVSKPDVESSAPEASAAEATERKPSESQAELPSEPTVGSAEPSPNETST